MDEAPEAGVPTYDTRPGYSPTNPQFPWGPFRHTALDLPATGDKGPAYEASWWRNGWGNDVFPRFDLYRATGSNPPFALGLIYTVDRSPDTQIDASNPAAYYQLGATLGNDQRMPPLFLDIRGIQMSQPVTLAPGATKPFEGRWYLHYRWYDWERHGAVTINIPFGVDVTPPSAVATLVAVPHKGFTGPIGKDGWSAARRADVQWADIEYDTLSGTVMYEVTVNGGVHPSSIFHLDHVHTNLTIENDVLMPGRNKIEVRAIDRANNKSDPSVTYFNSDPDTPTISVTAPLAGALVPARSTFSVVASDAAGIRDVKFKIDGELVHTDISAPYSAQLDLSRFANGTRVFSATVTDMLGRQVTTTRSFVLDKTFPVISNLTFGPTPFFPIIRDGNRDNMTVRCTISERAAVQLVVYNANGTIRATRSGNFAPGAVAIAWNGRGNGAADAPVPGRYTFRLRVQDPAGNVTWGPVRTVVIQNFELVRVGPNAVRSVPR